VAEFLGDAEATVQATYSHMMPDDRERARKAMERFFAPRSRPAPARPSWSAAPPPPKSTSQPSSAARCRSSSLPVAGLAFLLLTFAFRTILVPIKSIIGFLLSAGAALGAQVAVFQWGWLRSLFGATPSQTLSFLPIILLAVLFGLSSDYEVFVVSRIKEHFTKTGNAREAVIAGSRSGSPSPSACSSTRSSSGSPSSPPSWPSPGRRSGPPRWFGHHVPDSDIEGERLDANLSYTARHELAQVPRAR
jgi:MMPL family